MFIQMIFTIMAPITIQSCHATLFLLLYMYLFGILTPQYILQLLLCSNKYILPQKIIFTIYFQFIFLKIINGKKIKTVMIYILRYLPIYDEKYKLTGMITFKN